MAKKSLLQREEFHGVILYTPLITKPQGMIKWLEFIAHRVFEMDMLSTVAMFAKTNALNPDEIKELEALIQEANKGE